MYFILRYFILLESIVCFNIRNGAYASQAVQKSPLPEYLSNGLSSDGAPWANYDPSSQTPPDTGITRIYHFVVTRDTIAPDGVNKSTILINGQYPGPLIEANWGDTVQVTVENKILSDMEEGLTLHWHGILQKKTPWFDGVPGVSQCPIAPGASFTYKFQADQYGTTWYHSHYSAQYSDGLLGPLVIYGPPHVPYDIDLGTVLVTDWSYENYYQELQHGFLIPPVFPNIDNTLINGRGTLAPRVVGNGTGHANQYAAVERFEFTPGKTHRLRLVNTGSGGNSKFQIDNHLLTVITNDFTPIQPYTTDVVTLGIGQRADVLVHAHQSASDAVWMRADLDTNCLNLTYTNPTALAAVYFSQADKSKTPTTKGVSWQSNHCRNDPLNETTPFFPRTPPAAPATTRKVEIDFHTNHSGVSLLYVDGSSFRTDYNYPVLLLTSGGKTSYPDHPEWNIYNFGTNASVRMILTNTFDMQHPMHLHGHNFWVLAEGVGTWDGSITKPQNPLRRDTQILQPGTPEHPSYVVLEWLQDNPGIWPLHCHTSLHVSVGLYLNVMERPDAIAKDMQIPAYMNQTCTGWQAFTSHHTVDQIDSGV